ncbi:MAG: hypothetical protein AB7V62_09890 [Thermoleophilia bacterium]
MSGALLPPVAVASLAMLLVGGLGLLIGGLDDGAAVTVMAVVVLLVAAGLGAWHLSVALDGGGAVPAAAVPHRTVAWIALAAAVGAAVLMPVLFATEGIPGWVAVVAAGDGLLALPASLAALRGARRAGDGAGARLAAFAVGAAVVVVALLAAMAVAAIGIASSFS